MGRRGAALALLFIRALLRLLCASASPRSAWRSIDPASAARAAAEGGGLAAASALCRAARARDWRSAVVCESRASWLAMLAYHSSIVSGEQAGGGIASVSLR